jgi:hypothetical protein
MLNVICNILVFLFPLILFFWEGGYISKKVVIFFLPLFERKIYKKWEKKKSKKFLPFTKKKKKI